MKGLRALFVSDLHIVKRTTRADFEALIAKFRDASPDMLLLGGDYSDTVEGTVRFFEALRDFRPPLGSYGVIGNNDARAWTFRLEELKRVMAGARCEMIINGAVHLPVNGGMLDIAGIDEYLYGKPNAKGLYPDHPTPNRYRILLSHYPYRVDPAPDLMLSGHAHGGQFNLLGLTPFSFGFERLEHPEHRDWVCLALSGLHEVGDMKLLVSKGIGASRIQLRVGVRPEIDLLVF